MDINSLNQVPTSKPEEKHEVHPVISSGSAKRVKQSQGSKLFGAILGSNNLDDIKTHIIQDVAIPALTNGLYNVLAGALDYIFKTPGSNGAGRMGAPYNRDYTRYSSIRGGSIYNNNSYNRQQTDYQRPAAANVEYDQIVFKTMGDAQIVLDGMNEIIREYGIVTIADLIKLARLDDGTYVDTNWTDNNFGWKFIRPDAMPRYSVTRQGYTLPLSQPVAID